jgi:hypothetical protein
VIARRVELAGVVYILTSALSLVSAFLVVVWARECP